MRVKWLLWVRTETSRGGTPKSTVPYQVRVSDEVPGSPRADSTRSWVATCVVEDTGDVTSYRSN